MNSQAGTTYPQNYDVIIKWLAAALHGETLDVLGVPTGRIEEVFGFEPVDLPVNAGRVDVMLRDDRHAYYHIEEQRNLEHADLYRFAAYHFRGAQQWPRLTDIILASGEVYAGCKIIETNSGRYAPIVIDFTERDGWKRLAEIRAAIDAGAFTNWFELVFLPLYGKETGAKRRQMVEQVLRYEVALYHAEKLSARMLAATFILCNKLIDKQVLEQMWEEIKMLDILELAEEKGFERGKDAGLREGKDLGLREGKDLGLQEGKDLGLREGKDLGLREGKDLGLREGKELGLKEAKTIALEAIREMVVDTLIERFQIVSAPVSERIRSLHNLDVLKSLFHQAFRCQNLPEFEALLRQVT